MWLCFPFSQVRHVASAVLLKQFIVNKGKQSVDWLIKPSVYSPYKHTSPFQLRLAILAITKQHYTRCDHILTGQVLEKECNKILIS